MKYNTGNPVLPDGSNDPRDLSDNAGNLDLASNSLSNTWVDRLGRVRKTIEGAVRSASATPYLTLAELTASPTPPTTNWAIVTSDPNISNNGNYSWDGNAWVFSTYQPPSSQQLAEALEAIAKMPSPILSSFYSHAIGDEEGKVAMGVERGTGHLRLAQWKVGESELNGSKFLSSEWRWVAVSKNNQPIFGVRHDGSFYARGIQAGANALTSLLLGKEGNKTAFGSSGGSLFQLHGSGAAVGVSAEEDGFQKLTLLTGSGLSEESVRFVDPNAYASFVTSVLFVMGYGQSLSMGSTSSVILTKRPPAANLIRCPSYGIRLANQDDIVTSATPSIPMVASTTEVPVAQAVTQMVQKGLIEKDVGVFVTCNGRGGVSIEQLQKGGQYYSNLLTTVTQAITEAESQNKGIGAFIMDMIQGEADVSRDKGYWYGKAMQLTQSLSSDLSASVPMVLDQISNWTAYNRETSEVPFDQLQLAIDMPGRFYCAGPKYWLESSADGVHMPSYSSALCGAMHAHAIAAAENGTTWLPVHATTASRKGLIVDVKFHTPYGNLAIDKKYVSDPGMLGLRWIDSAMSANIVNVDLIGNNTIRCTLSAEPTGLQETIGIADIGISGAPQGPKTGPRSCLRDSVYDFGIEGRKVYHFACHQRILVA